MTGDKTLTYPLTDEEKKLVERYHNIIYKVMKDMGLMYLYDELYDVGALALMAAVRKYQTRSELQKYAFTTIAYINIKRAYAKNIATEVTVSLDAKISEDGLTLYDVTPAPDYMPKNSEKTLKAYSRVKELLSEKERMCVKLHLSGMSVRKIKQCYGIPRSTYGCAIRRARKKCFAHYGEIFDTTETAEMPKQEQRRITAEESAEILRLFDEGISMRHIGRILGRDKNVISRHVKKIPSGGSLNGTKQKLLPLE